MIKRIHFSLFSINLVISIPAVYMVLGLPLVFARNGWSGTTIGLFLLASLPSLAKFLLAYPVERFRLRGCHYVYWTAILIAWLIVVLLGLAYPEMAAHKTLLFMLMLTANLLIAWAEIPLNTLVIQLLPEEERLRAGGFRSAAMSVAAIIGGGVLLLLQQKFGWALPFVLMAMMLCMGLLSLILLAKPERYITRKITPTMPTIATVAGFFRQDYRVWLLVLLLWFALVAAVWTFLKPMLLQYGMPGEDIAILVGVGGGAVSALSALLSPALLVRLPKDHAMRAVALLDVVVLSGFSLLLFTQVNPYLLGMGALLIAVPLGLTSALIFRLMMDFVRVQEQPLYYGLQSALFQSGRIILSVFAGILVDWINYRGMILVMLALAILIYTSIIRHKYKLMYLFSKDGI